MCPWQSNGTFLRETPAATGTVAWADTKTAGDINITTTDHDFHDQDIATGITQSMNVAGLNAATADLNFGGFRAKAIANPTALTDAVNAQTIQKGAVAWAAAGGTADAITATYAPAITTLTDGMLLGVRIGTANGTTTPTFAPNGLTAHTITKSGGTALSAGDLQPTMEPLLRYNLASTRWEIVYSPPSSIPPMSVITTGQTLSAGTVYLCDTTSAAFNATLPASPNDGSTIGIGYINQIVPTNLVTILRNGKKIGEIADDSILNDPFRTLAYSATLGSWKVI